MHVCKNEAFLDDPKDSDKSIVLKSVFEAMAKLDPLCNDLIEKNILESNRLKTIQQELGISGTYNSIVKKKRRCIQKLKDLVEQQITSNSKTLQRI